MMVFLSGKGRGPCKNVDSMVYVWIIILAAITVIFMLAGVLNVAGEISENEQGGLFNLLHC